MMKSGNNSCELNMMLLHRSPCWCWWAEGWASGPACCTWWKAPREANHASMAKCWRFLTWLDVCFTQNSLRAIQLDTDLEDLMTSKEDKSARDLGAGMLTIHCRSCAKRDERQLETAVSLKLVWGSCKQNEAVLGAEWGGNLRMSFEDGREKLRKAAAPLAE